MHKKYTYKSKSKSKNKLKDTYKKYHFYVEPNLLYLGYPKPNGLVYNNQFTYIL